VLASFGIGVARDPANVPRWWDWIWTRNPARMPGRHHPPPGWVLEVDGQIQGFFGNIPGRYHIAGETLVAAIASHWAVHKPFREHTHLLSDAYFGQSGPELLVVSTGIAATGRIFRRHHASAMPEASYGQVLFWVLDAAGFAAAALRRRGTSAGLARAIGLAISPGLASLVALQRRRPGHPRAGLEPEAIRAADIGDEFDDLWQRKIAERRRLLAYRSAEDLRWHFEPRATDQVHVLRCRRSGRLAGYLVLYRDELPEIGLVRLRIVDLMVAGDDAAVLEALLAAAGECARESGAHVLEWVGLPRGVRACAELSRPFARQYADFPFFYRARDGALHGELEAAELWYPTLFDGDGCLGSI
jgi:hypothetical protein